MEAVVLIEVIAVVAIVLVVCPLLWLFVRRRYLSRQGGMFECGLRLNKTTPGAGWALGVARYSGEYLEWFRVFALSLRPHLRFRRTATVALESRRPNDAEAVLLYQGQRIVLLETPGSAGTIEDWELAMAEESVTGLLSWLEAAPPSVDRFMS